MLFDDHFDARFLVAGNYDEAGEVRRDSVVLRRDKLDLFDAVIICAFAMKRERLLDSVFLRTLIDALVDRAKHLFVVRRAVREIHRGIFARSLSSVGRADRRTAGVSDRAGRFHRDSRTGSASLSVD